MYFIARDTYKHKNKSKKDSRMRQYSCASRGFEERIGKEGHYQTAAMPYGTTTRCVARSAAAESNTGSCALLVSVHIARVSRNGVEHCPFGTAFDAFNGTGGRCRMAGGEEVADNKQ
ncbi:hypothetical protein GALMADRAFT_1247229 [Galerina marginata CBS 339.88]|uniref:Uncharacterized protein n=1 Tax=Galerina marginata (strain CBS 339.88) TaxID=685588 RepID=A0A067T8Y4_GALM3|nr:hypothetical protein GALMADRAFT_1247229 [Galerina marginata CBS 339.88]